MLPGIRTSMDIPLTSVQKWKPCWVTPRMNSAPGSNCAWDVFIRRILAVCMRATSCSSSNRAALTWNTGSAERMEGGSGYKTAPPRSMNTEECSTLTGFSAISRAEKRPKQNCSLKRHFSKHKPIPQSTGFLWWIPAEGRIVYANHASCATTQRSREELVGLLICEISPALSKDHWEKLWKRLKTGGSMTFESQLQAKSGAVVHVEINANYLMFDGQEYCFTFARDISERRALE